jgi:hypothetical protein
MRSGCPASSSSRSRQLLRLPLVGRLQAPPRLLRCPPPPLRLTLLGPAGSWHLLQDRRRRRTLIIGAAPPLSLATTTCGHTTSGTARSEGAASGSIPFVQQPHIEHNNTLRTQQHLGTQPPSAFHLARSLYLAHRTLHVAFPCLLHNCVLPQFAAAHWPPPMQRIQLPLPLSPRFLVRCLPPASVLCTSELCSECESTNRLSYCLPCPECLASLSPVPNALPCLNLIFIHTHVKQMTKMQNGKGGMRVGRLEGGGSVGGRSSATGYVCMWEATLWWGRSGGSRCVQQAYISQR